MKVEDLKNTKIYLSNEEDRIKFQEKVFKLGLKWADDSKSIKHIDESFYYIDSGLRIGLGSDSNSGFLFIEHKYKQIFLDEVFAIEEPKVKFKPFDRVLVRDFISDDKWLPREFADYHSKSKFFKYEATDGRKYNFCIPYKGNEELANSTKDIKK